MTPADPGAAPPRAALTADDPGAAPPRAALTADDPGAAPPRAALTADDPGAAPPRAALTADGAPVDRPPPGGGPLPEAVAVVIRRQDGRRLVVKRASTRPAPGYWTPVTGRLEPGESSMDAGAREVLEEVGLRVTMGPRIYEGLTAGGGFRLLWHEATLDEPGATVALSADEVEEARWLTLEEILELAPMFAETRRFFERALLAEGPPRPT